MIKLNRILYLFMFVSLITACAENNKSEYFVFLNTNPDKQELPEAEVESLQEQHMDYMEKLASDGDMVASGPFAGGGFRWTWEPTAFSGFVRDQIKMQSVCRIIFTS